MSRAARRGGWSTRTSDRDAEARSSCRCSGATTAPPLLSRSDPAPTPLRTLGLARAAAPLTIPFSASPLPLFPLAFADSPPHPFPSSLPRPRPPRLVPPLQRSAACSSSTRAVVPEAAGFGIAWTWSTEAIGRRRLRTAIGRQRPAGRLVLSACAGAGGGAGARGGLASGGDGHPRCSRPKLKAPPRASSAPARWRMRDASHPKATIIFL